MCSLSYSLEVGVYTIGYACSCCVCYSMGAAVPLKPIEYLTSLLGLTSMELCVNPTPVKLLRLTSDS